MYGEGSHGGERGEWGRGSGREKQRGEEKGKGEVEGRFSLGGLVLTDYSVTLRGDSLSFPDSICISSSFSRAQDTYVTLVARP